MSKLFVTDCEELESVHDVRTLEIHKRHDVARDDWIRSDDMTLEFEATTMAPNFLYRWVEKQLTFDQGIRKYVKMK